MTKFPISFSLFEYLSRETVHMASHFLFARAYCTLPWHNALPLHIRKQVTVLEVNELALL